VTPIAAVPIGIGAAVVGYYAILFIRGGKKVDDSLDVLACHGIGSTWGVIATGIFASIGAAGLLAGNPSQLLVQTAAVAVVWVYSFAVTFGIAKAVDAAMGLRVGNDEETVGLDISQHGEGAYS
jgi:Amt family ammonium transporter